MRHLCTPILVVLAAFSPAAVRAQVAQGDDFQVNSYTTSAQFDASLAVAPAGGFVVVWRSEGSDGNDSSDPSIQGQRYDATGSPLGTQFEVNSYTTGIQSGASVAIDASGAFVVVWESFGSDAGDSSSSSIQGQRYDASGNPLGTQFQINSYTTGAQGHPSVAIHPDGGFLVVWGSFGSSSTDSSSSSVQGRRYDASGNPLGPQFQVNSYTTSDQSHPSVAADPDGDFVVVWESAGSAATDSSGFSIQGRRYDANVTPLGSEFQVNSSTTNDQLYPSVALDPDGAFVVVWGSESSAATGSLYSIQGQRHDANGNPAGPEFQVNSRPIDSPRPASVAADVDGDFVVVWGSEVSGSTDTSPYSIQGQRYDAAGNPLGAQFQVNSYTTNDQRSPSVAAAADGDFVVVWQSDGSGSTDSSSDSIQGRRFRVTGDLGDRVWEDLDFDGVQDVGEPGMADVPVRVRDSFGDVVRSTTTDGDGAFHLQPKAGTWYLEFEPPVTHSFTTGDVGFDDTVDSDADPAFGQTVDIVVEVDVAQDHWDAGLARGVGNRVWMDDGDGLQAGGEAGFPGMTVELYDRHDNLIDSTITAADGSFSFAPPSGTYYLAFVLPGDMAFAPRDQGTDDAMDSDAFAVAGTTGFFSLVNGQVDTTWDAGVEPAVIGNRVWNDLNTDGRQQPGEPGVEGVTVRLLDDQDAVVASTVTGPEGIYQFAGIVSGSYRVEFTLPGGSSFTARDIGGDDLIDSDVDPATGRTALFTYAQQSASRSHDAGLVVDPSFIFADGFESGDTASWQ